MNSFNLIVFTVLLVLSNPSKNEMISVSETLYFQKTEVSNAEWKKFESELTENKKELALYRKNDVFKVDAWNKTYFQKYMDSPVVGVTKFGAAEYCNWLNNKNELKGVYRLPTKDEFHSAIRNGESSVKYQKRKIKADKKKTPFYNLNYDYTDVHGPSPVESFQANKLGIYNLIGNVSEIVAEDNIVVGGSWKDKDQLRWDVDKQEFMEPSERVGFRCVCEVK